jgi:hypothetical protein
MRKEFMRILLDQNIPQALAGWLRKKMPEWNIRHVNELGFQGKTDEFLYRWTKKNEVKLQYQSDKDRPCSSGHREALLSKNKDYVLFSPNPGSSWDRRVALGKRGPHATRPSQNRTNSPVTQNNHC